jgi:hypothetical protein
MAGLSSALAMQGRMGDSTLVHMNPMEVEMLKTMSPDGSLSINPETGLPEAFKLKDLAAFALPIAASIAFPMLAPSIGLGGLSGVATGAIGAGLGGVGAGLIQGKGVGDSLIQGGLSGLMSYGMGSAFAPAAPSGGITSALPEVGSTIDATQTASGLGLGGYNPAQSTFAYAPEAVASDAGLFGKLSANLQTPIAPETLGGATYGSALTAGGSGLLSSALLAPEEMPYDIDGMDDMDAYYNSRIPDLEAGRRRGRAAARSLNYPPSGSTGSQYYGMATSPGGFGTFYAADGGQVPKPYGDPYGPGDAYGGVADASNTSGTPGSAGTPGSESTSGSGLGSFGNSIDMGLGSFNPTPMSLGLTALGMVPGPIGMFATVANIGRGIASMMGPANVNAIGQSQVSGVGNQNVDAYGNSVGSMENIASEMNMGNKGFDAADDVEGMMSDAVQGFADAHEGEVGDAGAAAAADADAAAEAAATADAMGFAQGGIASLAYGGNPPPTGYANQAFEGTVPGVGTGMSDDVPFSIEGDQPALLSRDEYVLPADVVSQLGDGSSGAGSDMLDNFISQVRQTKYGNTQQPPPVGPQLMTGLMRSGGIV